MLALRCHVLIPILTVSYRAILAIPLRAIRAARISDALAVVIRRPVRSVRKDDAAWCGQRNAYRDNGQRECFFHEYNIVR